VLDPLFVFVGPAAVVRHGLAAELRRVGQLRIVHQHHQNLPGEILPLEIIPGILRGFHPIAHEHQRGVLHLDRGNHVPGPGDEVVPVFEILG
jgi:hypothetical protein